MEKILSVGIDVSKATLDVCFMFEGKEQHQIYANTHKGIKELIIELAQHDKKSILSNAKNL